MLLKISKVRYPLEKSLPLCKDGKKCKNRLLHPFFSTKGSLSSFGSCSLQWHGWLHYEYEAISIEYCQYHSEQTLLKHSNKVYCLLKPNKCITTIDFRLASAIFINLEHLSHPTLVLLFKF